jgi:excisionase family DNA binding protein
MHWLKVRGAAQHAGGVSERTVYQAIKAGKLRAARIGAGRNLVTSAEWVDLWLQECGGDTVADYQNEQPRRRRDAHADRPTDEPREPDSSIAEAR